MTTTTITRPDDDAESGEISIRVVYGIYGSYRRETRTDPAEDPELEVESATRVDNGEEVELTDREESDLFDAEMQRGREDRAEREIDAWEDRRAAGCHGGWL